MLCWIFFEKLKFQTVAEKTAKNIREQIYFAAPCSIRSFTTHNPISLSQKHGYSNCSHHTAKHDRKLIIKVTMI